LRSPTCVTAGGSTTVLPLHWRCCLEDPRACQNAARAGRTGAGRVTLGRNGENAAQYPWRGCLSYGPFAGVGGREWPHSGRNPFADDGSCRQTVPGPRRFDSRCCMATAGVLSSHVSNVSWSGVAMSEPARGTGPRGGEGHRLSILQRLPGKSAIFSIAAFARPAARPDPVVKISQRGQRRVYATSLVCPCRDAGDPRRHVSLQYFVGRYARKDFRMMAHGDNDLGHRRTMSARRLSAIRPEDWFPYFAKAKIGQNKCASSDLVRP